MEKANGFKPRYQYIHFVQVVDKDIGNVWSCRNNRSDAELGVVRWYPAWRQYCYFPTAEAVYNVGCLRDINDFIGQL